MGDKNKRILKAQAQDSDKKCDTCTGFISWYDFYFSQPTCKICRLKKASIYAD